MTSGVTSAEQSLHQVDVDRWHELAVLRYPPLDDLVHGRVVATEPRTYDLPVGQPRELVEVLLRRERPPVLCEELAEDLAEDRLVMRERPVEVEDDGSDRQGAAHYRRRVPLTALGLALAAAFVHAL